jgi:DNA-binding CsgD family transcriptional regulator
MESKMLLSSEHPKKTASLTERQESYLTVYKKEKSATKTASAMGVTTDTAREQLKKIATKLGLNTIKEIIQDELNQDANKATSSQLMALIEQQEYRCALTGLSLTPKVAELDHIVPRSKGGTDEITNLQWLHKRANRMKGTMDNELFIETCKLIAQHNAARAGGKFGSQSSLN